MIWVMTLSLLALCALVSPAGASDCDPWVAQIVSIEGLVETRAMPDETWRVVRPGETFCFGDQIRVGENSRGALVLQNHTFIRLDAQTTLDLSQKEESVWVRLLNGLAHFFSRTPRRLNISTPFVNASVEGTEFLIGVGPTEATVTVFEGKVLAANDFGEVQLKSGQSAVTRPAAPPIIRAARQSPDAVQWALYYPAVLQFEPVDFEGHPPESWQSLVARSIELYKTGDLLRAFEAVEKVGEAVSDSRFFTYRASLRLSVGRVEEARADIDRALSLNPNDGDGHALKAVIAVVQNDRETAREAVEQAVTVAPNAAGPHLAASLVRQAEFELEKARESAAKAVKAAPDRPLGWARLAEIHLMFGDLEAALKAAQKAVEIDPAVAQTQTVLGFAHLSRIDLDAAEEAFEKAITLDPGAPLPRLGLGLLKIRKGALEEGRREIETAAVLDPGNTLIRSYLGKAYFEEKRDKPAAGQYNLAKELDEQDPTPYLYSAILHQTQNRPVLALRDIQKSIERNDARAIYRSRLLLDEDLAVRSAGLGRIYQDLGFEQRALVEGWKSVTLAPEDYSGHRLLADSYAALPGHQMARASELLQSQLLQEINLTPIQPQLAETNLAILEGTGPSALSFNEFNPLFVRNRVAVQADGVVGNNGTRGDDLVLSAIHGPFSLSVGQFHYQSEGFRKNNDLRHDVYNIFAQAAVTSRLNLQAELRRRETEQGDVTLNFDPDDFSLQNRREIRQDSARLGGRYSLNTSADAIVSLIYNDRQGDQKSVIGPVIHERIDSQGYQAEAQMLFRRSHLNVTAGIGRYDIDHHSQTVFDWSAVFPFACPPSPPFPPVPCATTRDFATESGTVYFYTRLYFSQAGHLDLGGSYQTFKERGLDLADFSPKFGLQWDVTHRLQFRAVYVETIKQPLMTEQTIEPTQVAGFNQVFDDRNGTEAKRRGVGLDAVITKDLLGGVEGTWHDLEVPDFEATTIEFQDHQEQRHRVYLYWTPYEEWAIGVSYRLNQIRNLVRGPEKLHTTEVPISLRYFSPVGGFMKIETAYLRQKVRLEPVLPPATSFAQDREETFLVDVTVGFRLPKRIGLITFEVKNLFDRKFFFQDTNFIRPEPVYPEFIPDRTFLARATLSF
jgi:tetratricopeptide (TPR) repeat protein